jgi:hypothetical protein
LANGGKTQRARQLSFLTAPPLPEPKSLKLQTKTLMYHILGVRSNSPAISSERYTYRLYRFRTGIASAFALNEKNFMKPSENPDH